MTRKMPLAFYIISCFDLQTGDFVKCLDHKGVVTSVQVVGDFVFTAGYEGLVRCYNVQVRN